MRSAILEISFLIAAFIVGWIFSEWRLLLYIAIGLIAFYVIIMIIYMVAKRAEMSRLDKFLGAAALIGWLAIAWVLIQEKVFSLWGL
ncbi:MAG: hypothetical protein ACOX0E_08820 [Syntrophomonadaceae bacterium]